MPEKQPLQRLVPLELVLESKSIVSVVFLYEVEELGAGLHDGEGRGLGVVDQDWDTAIRIESEEPLVFLDVGRDVTVEGSLDQIEGLFVVLERGGTLSWCPKLCRKHLRAPRAGFGLFGHWVCFV